MRAPSLRQAGMALPIMLIMLTVMLVSSIYLLKSTTSTTLTTSNLAYDSALSKSVDLGINTGYLWLMGTDPGGLIADQPGAGYVATLNPLQTVSTPAFWNGAQIIVDGQNNQIQYVIHRACTFPGTYNSSTPVANSCQLSAPRKDVKAATAMGESLTSGSQNRGSQPELHYVITARIVGARGANVVNQAVVMMSP
ncbi:hypothetical protein HSX11_15265 [Oxalobacteraceae bacterium]|nr:hypothetical protein [Oxalobacteraceae bacterium]